MGYVLFGTKFRYWWDTDWRKYVREKLIFIDGMSHDGSIVVHPGDIVVYFKDEVPVHYGIIRKSLTGDWTEGRMSNYEVESKIGIGGVITIENGEKLGRQWGSDKHIIGTKRQDMAYLNYEQSFGDRKKFLYFRREYEEKFSRSSRPIG